MRLIRSARTLCVAAIYVGLFLAVAACDDFYSDSPPLSTGPTATVPANSPADPAASIEQAARSALAGRIGVAPEAPRLLSLTGVTWTASSPGCYPFDTAMDAAALVPGITATLEYENVQYQYHADQRGISGALCDFSRRDVAASSAASVFDGTPPDPAEPMILTTQQDASAYLAANPGSGFNIQRVDWGTEAVGAISVEIPDTSMEPLVRGARLSEDGTVVTLELTAYQSATPQPGMFPAWVFLEDIGTAANLEVEVLVAPAPGPTQTPPPFVQQ